MRGYVNNQPVGRFEEIDWPTFQKRAEEGDINRIVIRGAEIVAVIALDATIPRTTTGHALFRLMKSAQVKRSGSNALRRRRL
ncbi:MAG: hypothetical protein HY291_14125 [Planctomycetes bacterium]|nr:hypothetical protein [Planctomycetota bacterium]